MASEGEAPNGNGNGGPWWAKTITVVGVPGFLLFFLLGGLEMVGAPSPILKINELSAEFKHHRKETRRLIRVWGLVCRGVWQGSPANQEECDRTVHGVADEEPKP